MSRKVRICTISMDSRVSGERSMVDVLLEIEKKIDAGAVDHPDLYLLPEACLSGLDMKRLVDEKWYISPGNHSWLQLGKLAKTHNAYIAAGVLTLRDRNRYNSVIVFDRDGRQVFIYDKAYLTPSEIKAGMMNGPRTPECFDSWFGKIGFAVCFDLNFRDLFENYYRQGMEILLFPSYFPGGRILSNIAFDFSCFAVSSHAQGDESVFVDNFGREIARANMFTPALTQSIELDSAVFHLAGNIDKVKDIKRKYGDNTEIEIHRSEAMMMIRVIGNSLTIIALKDEFELQPAKEFCAGVAGITHSR